MKVWQIVVLIYLTAAVIGACLGWIRSPWWVDPFIALGLSLAGYRWIRQLLKHHNPRR